MASDILLAPIQLGNLNLPNRVVMTPIKLGYSSKTGEVTGRHVAFYTRRVRGGVRQPGMIHAGDLEIDINGHRVNRSGESIHLTRNEFNLLAVLAQHPGQTYSRSQLLDRLHGVRYDGFDRSIDAHIKNLRRKIEPDPLEPTYIHTVYGVGYRFTDEV